jgi:outer membrane immunogenic protein
MKRLLLATIALAALVGGGPAFAADLRPVYKAAPPPPPPVYFSWTGCYVGGNVGGVWVSKEATGPNGGTASADLSGGAAGIQAGCNYQFAGGFVIGIQGDYDWANASADRTGVIFPNLTTTYRVKSVSSLTGRIGYGWDRFLGYVKGGVAWERDELTFSFPGLAIGFSDTRNGWTIGIGGEYAFSNWITGFVEYDFYDFGTRGNNVVCGPVACFVGGPGAFLFDVKETKSVFKVGLNFLFNGGKGPVAARY